MKQAVLIKTDGTVKAVDISVDFNDFVHSAIGCDCYECLRSAVLQPEDRLLVDESGRIKGLDFNAFASFLYGSADFDTGIVGDALVVRVKLLDSGERDLDGFLPQEADNLVKVFRVLSAFSPLLILKRGR